MIQWCLTLHYLLNTLTGIMSQCNSAHQHHEKTTTHTHFLTRDCRVRLLAPTVPAVKANLPSSYLQICQSQPANDWKLSAPHGVKTSDTNYQVRFEPLCMLCMCQILSCEEDVSIICGCCSPQPVISESQSKSVTAIVGNTQTHKLANLNIVWLS